jgi:hypothetical protein
MASGLGSVLVGGLWIALAVVAAYGVVVGGWRVIGRRNEEGIGLLLTGSTALVLFALRGDEVVNKNRYSFRRRDRPLVIFSHGRNGGASPGPVSRYTLGNPRIALPSPRPHPGAPRKICP